MSIRVSAMFNSGHKFTALPSATVTINDTLTSVTDYTITNTNQVVDSNNNITGATFEVSFETPAAAMTVRDDIQWSVCTNQITITNSQVTLTVQDDPNDH